MRQQSLEMQAFAHRKEAEAVSLCTDTSRWSSPSRSDGSEIPQFKFEREDKVDAIPSLKWHPGRKLGIFRGKKALEVSMQKETSTTNHHMVKLPPIKPLQTSPARPLSTSKPSMQAASLNCTRELKSKVCNLQQQLCESRTENKLLKRVQHRHMMALQHFQDSEGSVSQIVAKHKNEARVLQELLRSARTCRDNLARQLQATEDKLQHTKETLRQLQLLIQDQSLQERQELTLKLAKASAELEWKDKRILDMEKNLELCRASFYRQIVAEQKKTKEARKISIYLQGQIHQLTRDLADRDRNIEKHNIYSHRFLKGSSSRGRKTKVVQTDGLVQLHTDGAQLEQQESSGNLCYGPAQESLVIKNLERGGPANLVLDENHQDDTQISENVSGKSSSSDKSPEPQTEENEASESTCMIDASGPAVKYLFSAESPENKNDGDKAVSEAPHVFEEKRVTGRKSTMAFVLERSLNPAEPERRELRFLKFRHYTFMQTTENLHNGAQPANSSVDLNPHESSKAPSDLHIPDGKTEGGRAHSSHSE